MNKSKKQLRSKLFTSIFILLLACSTAVLVKIPQTKAQTINDPASWRFLAGGDNNISPQSNAKYVHDVGANGVYFQVFLDAWNNPLPITASGLTQTEWAIQYAQALHKLGLLVELQNYEWAYFSADYNPQTYFENTINNVNGQGDLLITQTSKAIQALQPDIVQLYNEPVGSNVDGTTSYMSEYVAFVNKAMAAYAQVKPGLTFVVMGVPCWNLTTINSLNFIVPTGSKLLYSIHVYYWWGGYANDGTPTTSRGLQWEIDYWNGDFAQAKTNLDNSLRYSYGVQDAWDHGHTVYFEETGTNIDNANYEQFLNDFWSWCVTNSIGFVNLSNNNQDSTTVAGGMSGGIFNNDYSLNGIGQIWRQYAPSPIPIPTPSQTPIPTPTQTPIPTPTTYNPSPTPTLTTSPSSSPISTPAPSHLTVASPTPATSFPSPSPITTTYPTTTPIQTRKPTPPVQPKSNLIIGAMSLASVLTITTLFVALVIRRNWSRIRRNIRKIK